MTAENLIVPDLLQRFVPTPYTFTVSAAKERIHIESNDLELACGICQRSRRSGDGGPPDVVCWKLIRDGMAPCNVEDPTVLLSGPLRTLFVGTGTILVFDRERREILGFLAPGITVERLITALIPLLVDIPNLDGPTSVPIPQVAVQNELLKGS